ncbi:Hypothetical predicted protein [Olea europaea subsp. europaea]|uniref:Uncharacterized protein n=1 Tax=Olea europaea subsp. europaea TaxID=158383 RepID=A0A8S0RMU9_OLEEU|nr:Hypothetical predicted protein [Olea europaea subsp. europaea]
MGSVIPHETILVNLTELPLQFAVLAQSFTIRSLNPGGKQLVNSSQILEISRPLESASWPIKVLKDEQFSALKSEGRHFLDYVVIAFEFRRIKYDKYILVAEGVKEKKDVDMFLRMGYVILDDITFSFSTQPQSRPYNQFPTFIL